MSNPTLTGQDEARQVLADKILYEREYAKAHGFMRSTLFLTYEDASMIAAALRAPSLDRGAEEMRERAAQVCEAVADSRLGKVHPMGAAAATFCAQNIRTLPVPADLNEGVGK